MVSDANALRSAVIGCGAIAHQHLPFLARSPRSHLVGVCDTSKASAAFAKERFGADAYFTDADELLSHARPDVVHVLTPPHTHVPLVKLCLEAGVHVICEKPMTGSAEETMDLLQRAAASGRMLVETRNLLFNDAILAMDRLVEEDRLGAVREVDILLSLDITAGPFGDLNLSGPGVALPGGAVHDFLPHLAYLFLHFVGHVGEVDAVTGRLDNASGNSRVGFDQLDALVSVGERRGRLRLASDLQPDTFRVAVRGTRGSVETDLYQPFMWSAQGGKSALRRPFEQMSSGIRIAIAGARSLRDKVMQHGTYHGMPRMLAAVYKAIAEDAAPPISVEQMTATAMLVDRLVDLGRRPA